MKEILERYSCRDFLDTPLTTEQTQTIVQAALAAPSGLNRMPWHIIAITNKNIIDKICAKGMDIVKNDTDQVAYERLKSRGGTMLYNAPAMFLIATKTDDIYTLRGNSLHSNISLEAVDLGIVCQNIALSANSLGLGSVICAIVGMVLNGCDKDFWKKELQIPKGYEFGMAVLVGSAKTTKPPHDLDMTKVSYIN